MVSLRQRLSLLRLDDGLVYWRSALHVGREVGARRDQVVFHLLAVGCAGGHGDAGRINSLLLHQVVLGVDRAHSRRVLHWLGMTAFGFSFLLLVHGGPLLGVGLADHHRLCVG